MLIQYDDTIVAFLRFLLFLEQSLLMMALVEELRTCHCLRLVLQDLLAGGAPRIIAASGKQDQIFFRSVCV